MKILLYILLVLALFLIADALICRKWLEVSHTEIDADIKKSIRLVHITDLHEYRFGRNNELLLNKTASEKPDYICITGDFINCHSKRSDESAQLMQKLREIAPVIYIKGNHELKFAKNDPVSYAAYVEKLEKSDIIILDDSVYDADGVRFLAYTNKLEEYPRFTGIPELKPSAVEDAIKISDKSLLNEGDLCYNILLVHNPVYFDIYSAHADLVLAGHLHGGIIRLPFIGGIMSPQTFFGRKYNAGLYKKDGSLMYVSRGLGLHTFHLRIFNRPELAVITIKQRGK